jgi:ubiquitin-like protein Pup
VSALRDERALGAARSQEAAMATRDEGGQRRANRQSDEADEAVDPTPAGDVQERHEKLSEDVDSLLDEIDDVLEENAEEFVKSYVQKGGE